MKKYKFFTNYILKNKTLFVSSNILSVLSAIFGGLTIGIIIPLIEPNTEGIFSDINLGFLGNLDDFLSFLNSFSGDTKIRIICLIIVVFAVLEFITMYATYLISSIIQIRTLKTIQTYLISKTKKINLLTFSSFEQGRLFSMTVNESKVLSRVLARIINGIRDLWLLITFSVVLILVSPVMAISGLFLLGVLTNLVNGRLGNMLKKREKSYLESTELIFSELDETLKSFKSIKASGYEDDHFKRILNQFEKWRKNEWEVLKISILPQPILNLLNSLSIASLLFIGTILFPDNKNDWLGLMIPFFLFIFKLLPTVNSLNSLRIKLKGVAPYLDRFHNFELISADNEEFSGNQSISEIKDSIEIKNLSFNFNNSDSFSLKDINIIFRKHKMTSIVGPSGSGKTTLVNLLLGLMSHNSGEILIDGKDIKDLDINQYRKKISYVEQDTFFFNRTISENLNWQNRTINKDDLIEASKLSSAIEFIENFEKGFETKLGAGGSELSGGQKQRLAITRAFLNNSDFIILDESTSNLDYASELDVYKNIEPMLDTKGLIVIAHRYSTIKNSDLIIFIDSGRILEMGTHDELLAKKGSYYNQLKSGELIE
tara:strand:- start:12378 stop:14177 length:1800 start_codon:yes stop_codon:yes gene_type:complete